MRAVEKFNQALAKTSLDSNRGNLPTRRAWGGYLLAR